MGEGSWLRPLQSSHLHDNPQPMNEPWFPVTLKMEISQKSLLSHLQYIPCVSWNWSGSRLNFWSNYYVSAVIVGSILSLLYGSFFFKLLTTLTFFCRFPHSGFSICGWFKLCSQVFQPDKLILFLHFSHYLLSPGYLTQAGNLLGHSSTSKLLLPVFFVFIELSKFSLCFVGILYFGYKSFCWIYVLQWGLSFHL